MKHLPNHPGCVCVPGSEQESGLSSFSQALGKCPEHLGRVNTDKVPWALSKVMGDKENGCKVTSSNLGKKSLLEERALGFPHQHRLLNEPWGMNFMVSPDILYHDGIGWWFPRQCFNSSVFLLKRINTFVYKLESPGFRAWKVSTDTVEILDLEWSSKKGGKE